MADNNNQLGRASAIAVRLANRDPGWVIQTETDLTVPPNGGAAGVSLADSPSALLTIGLRRIARARTVRITPTSLVAGDSFTITVNAGTAIYDSTGDPDTAAILTGIANEINTDADTNTIVVATAVDLTGDGVVDVVDVVGIAVADFTFNMTTGGASTFTMEGDAASATAVTAFFMGQAPNTTPPADWFYEGADITISNPRNRVVIRRNTGGYARAYLQLLTLVGVGGDGGSVTVRRPDVIWGPGLAETS